VSTYTDIRDAIRAVADAGSDTSKLSLGTPGSHVRIAGTTYDTGKAWGSGKAVQMQWEGYSVWFDANIKAKINEIVAQYNQLRIDYDAGTVPTSANSIAALP